MAELYVPEKGLTETQDSSVQEFLNRRGIDFEKWEANFSFDYDADQETILKAYDHQIRPLMESKGYQSADVINVHSQMENLQSLREKFLSEHTHSEDEVRFFVDGEGQFWFHLDNGEVFRVICRTGDFISVPAGVKHWFDLAPKYFVKAIRIFTSKEGWVAQYTHSGVEKNYL